MRRLGAMVLAAGLAGCGPAAGDGGPPPQAGSAVAVAPHRGPRNGTLAGRVVFRGAVPDREPFEIDVDRQACCVKPIVPEDLVVGADGGLQGAVVWVEGCASGAPPATGTVRIDQVGCVYVPHVTAVRAGQVVQFTNSDAVFHNVSAQTRRCAPFNVALPQDGDAPPFEHVFETHDVIKLTCDAHKWMAAWVIVRPDPYVAVTAADGTFRIEGLPRGTHTLVVWHERLARHTGTITVPSAAGSSAGATVEGLEIELRER